MSSVDYKKLHGINEVRAMLKHDDREERLQHEHSNKQIDLSLTDRNQQMDDMPGSYDRTVARYKAWISRLDALPNANRRKDRVTAFSLCVPLPEGLAAEDQEIQDRWFDRVIGCYKAVYGRDPLAAYTHYDEIHQYIDKETGERKVSRPHIHIIDVPEINGKLNGKAYSNVKNINTINQSVDDMSISDFGVHFSNGKGRRGKTVEQLKAESRAAELQQQNDDLQQRLQEGQRQLVGLQQQIRQQATALEQAKAGAKAEIMKYTKNECAKRWHELDQREKEAAQKAAIPKPDAGLSRPAVTRSYNAVFGR